METSHPSSPRGSAGQAASPTLNPPWHRGLVACPAEATNARDARLNLLGRRRVAHPSGCSRL
jgi:hypothetical protein